MNTNHTHSNSNSNFVTRLHPLVAVAAASVLVVSLLGAAALTGILPSSGATVPAESTSSEQVQTSQKAKVAAPQKALGHNTAGQSTPVASTAPAQAPAAVPAAPAQQNSAIGIGVGAVVGGLLGNQVGSGDGKTLATIAGAVGGGYVGNEIAKKNQ